MNFKKERLMMTEEEARNRAKELLNENQVDLIIKYMFLEQQCKKQKEVIDKLKRYINGCLEVTPNEDRNVTDNILDNEFKYLLKILSEVSE